jgi:hypothetical protein
VCERERERERKRKKEKEREENISLTARWEHGKKGGREGGREGGQGGREGRRHVPICMNHLHLAHGVHIPCFCGRVEPKGLLPS